MTAPGSGPPLGAVLPARNTSPAAWGARRSLPWCWDRYRLADPKQVYVR
ncbi:hypothetical protein ACFVYD_03665 [Streptomyces sp. NPDC058301]